MNNFISHLQLVMYLSARVIFFDYNQSLYRFYSVKSDKSSVSKVNLLKYLQDTIQLRIRYILPFRILIFIILGLKVNEDRLILIRLILALEYIGVLFLIKKCKIILYIVLRTYLILSLCYTMCQLDRSFFHSFPDFEYRPSGFMYRMFHRLYVHYFIDGFSTLKQEKKFV